MMVPVTEMQTAHTADLNPATLAAARALRRLDGRARAGDGAIYVLPLRAPLDLASELTCDWRDGDVW